MVWHFLSWKLQSSSTFYYYFILSWKPRKLTIFNSIDYYVPTGTMIVHNSIIESITYCSYKGKRCARALCYLFMFDW